MARESASERLERRRREEGTNYGEQDLQKTGRAVKRAGKALFGTEGDSASQKLERARREEAAAKRRPTSDLKGTKLNRERGDSSKQLNPKTMTGAERGAAGRTKQSRRGTVKVEKAPPAFTKVERQPVTQVKAPKSSMKTDMSEGRSRVSADRGTGTGLSRTIGSARTKAEEKGTKAKNFMSKSGKAKAAVTAEELAKFRKKSGNTNLTYRGALRKFLNERDGLTTKKAYETKKPKKMAEGGAVKGFKKGKTVKGTGNRDTKSGKSYTLEDFAFGRVKLGDAVKDTKFNKRQGTVRSIDKKDPKQTAKEIKSVLKGPKKPKKMMGGGMAMAEKPYKHGKEVKGYKVGKTVKSSKMRGAGIESKGTRPCKMR
tara:strand:- start:379 stop:1491 length:1113 start_codon:yes stop_codon:yes gene_type:complete